MRRIIAFNHVSVDGYFADNNGGLDWVVPEDALDDHALANMADADTILFGRKTYEMFEHYWPKAAADPQGAADPHGAGQRSPALRRIAAWIDEATKVVFSKSRHEVAWRHSRLVPQFSVGEIEALKRGPGKSMMVFGSGTLASALTEHGLIDEYQFAVAPVILGEGRALIGGVRVHHAVACVESRPLPKGTVLMRYQLTRPTR